MQRNHVARYDPYRMIHHKSNLYPEERQLLRLKGKQLADFLADRSEPSDSNGRKSSHCVPRKRIDLIIVFGVGNLFVAERAADVFLRVRETNPDVVILFAGGSGRATPHAWKRQKLPEAEAMKQAFLDRMREIKPAFVQGKDFKVLTEGASTNAGENVRNACTLLNERGMRPDAVLLLHTPLLQYRAALATWLKQSTIQKATVYSYAPFRIDFEKLDDTRLCLVSITAVGELRRLEDYPDRGFTVEVSLESVNQARNEVCETLVAIMKRCKLGCLPNFETILLQTVEFGKEESEDGDNI